MDMPTVAIVGRPNVGKSTLFNRLVGKKLALVDDRPGVTRDRREGDVNFGGLVFRIIDTAGLEEADPGSLARPHARADRGRDPRGRRRAVRHRRPRRRAAGRPALRRDGAARRLPGDPHRQQGGGRRRHGRAPTRRSRSGLGDPDPVLGRARRGHRRVARCAHRVAAEARRRGRGVRRRSGRTARSRSPSSAGPMPASRR